MRMAITIRRRGSGPSVAAATILIALISKASALTQQYCSSQNTGADSSPVQDNFQSNGACQQTCAGYAFAVVQYQSCWCSDYVPADTTSTSSCSVACPGYPYENCGDESAGLFGYVALGPAPSGTQGSASSADYSSPTQATQPTVQSVSAQSLPVAFSGVNLPSVPNFSFTSSTSPLLQPSTSFNGPLTVIRSAPISFETHVLTLSVQYSSPDPSSVTVLATVTDEPSVKVSYVSIMPPTTSTSITQQPTIIPVSTTPDTTTTIPTTTPTTTPTITPVIKSTTLPTTPSISSTWTPTPYTSVMTITGQVKTLTVTPTAPPAAAATTIVAAKDNNGGFFSSTGKVAGTFVAVGIIIFAIAAALIWFFFRRRRQEDAATIPSTVGGNTPQHTPQRRPSRLSQMGLIGGASEGEKNIPRLQTSGWGPGNSAEKSPADTLSADRRSSLPRVVDQRLEPTALWNPLHDNGSHVSVRSFRDDQDYSRRMLRIANPDDE